MAHTTLRALRSAVPSRGARVTVSHVTITSASGHGAERAWLGHMTAQWAVVTNWAHRSWRVGLDGASVAVKSATKKNAEITVCVK